MSDLYVIEANIRGYENLLRCDIATKARKVVEALLDAERDKLAYSDAGAVDPSRLFYGSRYRPGETRP
jgi:hypothetical protein